MDFRIEPAAFDYRCPECGGDIKADDPVVFYGVERRLTHGVWLMCQGCFWNEWREVDPEKFAEEAESNRPH